MDQFIRKLRRELTRNPKKTAILGVGLAVAIYFWAPLVGKWFSKPGSSRGKSVASGVAAPAVEQARPPVVAGDALAALPDWRELARRVDENPLRRLAAVAAPGRDPFFSSLRPPAEEDAAGETEDGEAAETATTAGAAPGLAMKLEGILVRGRTRAAIIGGVAYRERDEIQFGPPAGASAPAAGSVRQTSAVLEEIGRDYVIVKWRGQAMRIELERPALAPGDRITPSGSKTSARVRIIPNQGV
jgi:hypothetical protein